MKKTKLWTILFISILTILCVSIGIRSFSENTSYKPKPVSKRIVLIGNIDNNPYWQAVRKGAEDAADKRGCTLEYMDSKDGSLKDGIRQLDMAIESKADGIITYVQEEGPYIPYINKGIEKEIPIVTIDSDANESNRVAYVGSDNIAAGEAAARELLKTSKASGAIGIITGSLSTVNQKERIEGFENYVKKNSGLKVESVETSGFSMLQAELVAKQILKDNPEINYLYCTNAFDGAAAAKAVDELYLSDKVEIISFDDIAGSSQYIKEGVIAAIIVQNPYDMGYKSLNTILDRIEGKAIQQHQNVPFKIIDKSNIDKYNVK